MKKITIAHLVTDGLGYCCEYGFFRRYKRTGLIAERLGVSERAVRYRKELFRSGEVACQHCEKCIDKKLKALGR